MAFSYFSIFFFFFNDTATTEIYTLSLHDALPISRHGAGRELRSGAAVLGSRDAGRQCRASRARRAAAAPLARRARQPHAVSHRLRGADGGPRAAVAAIAPPLLAPARDLSAASHHARSSRAASTDRDLARNLGARQIAVPRIFVHGWRGDARAAGARRYGIGAAEPVPRRTALHGAEHVLRGGRSRHRNAALRSYVDTGAVPAGLGRRPAGVPRGTERVGGRRVRPAAGGRGVSHQRCTPRRVDRLGPHREYRR